MNLWIGIWIAVVLGGMALLLFLYGKLLSELEQRHPEVFTEIGSPTLFMASPRRSIALQKFVYSGSRHPCIGPNVALLCRAVGILTPVYVVVAVVGLVVLPQFLFRGL